MSIYYIFTKDGNIYELDATSEMSVEETGTPTKYPIGSREVVSDHYINYEPVFNISGSISDIKSSQVAEDRAKSTEDFISGLKTLKRSRQTFRVVWREDSVGGGSSPTFFADDCVFTSLKFNQNKARGYAFGRYSYAVSLTIEQLRFAQQTDIIVERSNLLADMTSEKQRGSGATTEFTDPNTGEAKSPSVSDFTFGDFADQTVFGLVYGLLSGGSNLSDIGGGD